MEIAIGIIGLIIAWVTFSKTFYAEPKEEKASFLAYFLATQKLSKEVSQSIYSLAEEANAWQSEIFPGVTYRTYYNALINSQNTNLSDELYTKIKNQRLTKSNIDIMQKSLHEQYVDLQKLQSALILVSKPM